MRSVLTSMNERYTVVIEIQVPIDAESFGQAGELVMQAAINAAMLQTLGGRVNAVEVYLGDFGEEVPGADDSSGGD